MSVAIPLHSTSTPLFLLMAEARAIIARTEPPEFTRAQQKALARKALEAKGIPLSHRCAESGCTAIIVDIDLLTGSLRDRCWEHSGPHRRRKSSGDVKMHCLCGSRNHGWCSSASKRFAPNHPGPRVAEWADMVLS